MKHFLFVTLCFVLVGLVAQAQPDDPKTLQATAKTYTRQGDYANAIVVLGRALQADSNNLELLKDLALNYYLAHNYTKALETAKPFPDRPDVDVQAYQILAMIYKAIEEKKESEKLYKGALKKFPESGPLYNEYGELLWGKKDYSEAIRQWEKGIELSPSYPSNYYNAAKYYYFSQDKTWSILYGEIFVNLESYTQRTAEIKDILMNSYKKLFAGADITKGQSKKNAFVNAFLEIMQKNASALSSGVTPESLTVLRTRFILDWYNTHASRFPFRLFDYQQQLLKAGLFDAYNQWIFGAAGDLPAFQTWSNNHADEYKKFTDFQHNRVFRVPSGQYYQGR